jgi:prepilin-type N-terminal cleavage/methylation domain-containing protein
MKPFLRKVRAFTLVEILVALGIVAVLGSVGYVSVTGVREQAASGKLEQDVRVLNNAIDSYLASGGSLDGVTTASAVLAKLKTRASTASAAATLGSVGSFVDPRTQTVTQTSAEAASSTPRAYFTSSPSPRFFTATTGAAGIKEFTLDETAAAGAPATENRTQTLAEGSTWIWNYTNATPPAAPAMLVPTAVDAAVTLSSGTVVLPLQPPTITPAGGARALNLFPIGVSFAANPNPAGSSAIYYSVNNGPYVLYVGTQFPANPGDIVRALCVTLDPSRYSNSGTVQETYDMTPLQLVVSLSAPASVTYAQAGGAMIGQAAQTPPNATVNLVSTVPSAYLTGANFSIRYTTDGTDPFSSGTAVTYTNFVNGTYSSPQISLALANFRTNGTNVFIPIRAGALAINPTWFISSALVSNSVTASLTTIGSPTVSPTNQTGVSLVRVSMTNPTVNAPNTNLTIRYTTNGTVPTASSTLYSAPFDLTPFAVNEQKVVTAVAFPPASLSAWFNASASASVTYTGPTPPNWSTAGGILINGGTFANNSLIRGSVTVATSTNGIQPNLVINNNGGVTGDMFVPGTPTVSGIATNRVINLNGAVTPTNYTITFGNNATLGGNVYRRINPQIAMPTVTAPTGLTNRANASSGTLLPGIYNTVSPGNNGSITLGVPGTNVSRYVFTNFTSGNNVRINVVGPVELFLNPGANVTVSTGNNMVVGNSTNPAWLNIRMLSGNFRLANNGTVYGSVSAPRGTVTFDNNTTFNGGVTAGTFNLQNNGAGIVFSLPPPL